MKHYTQAFLHDPANGVYGDCWRTAIGCLLDTPPDRFRHEHREHEDGEQLGDMRAELADQGLSIIHMGCDGAAHPDVRAVCEFAALFAGDDCRFVLGGRTDRGTLHVVVADPRGMVWDPHPSRAGLVGPDEDGWWSIYFIGRRV